MTDDDLTLAEGRKLAADPDWRTYLRHLRRTMCIAVAFAAIRETEAADAADRDQLDLQRKDGKELRMSAPHPVNLIEEILDSGGIAASGVALILPKGKKGRPTNPAQIRAWMQTGIMTPSGHRLILESAWIGGRRLTTRAALARFIAAQNLDASGPHPL